MNGLSEHLTSHDDTPRVCFEEQMIVDLRNRFFAGVDEDILFLQQPMRELQFQAEQASYERYQRRLSRLMKTIGEPAQ
jgi:hypothetical protein